MGVHQNIDYEKFPEQGPFLNKRVKVCFHYETDRVLFGTVVRDDLDEPYLTLIHLEDGRIVEDSECQFNVV
ncbi:hypothetical protein [Sporolactobacillus sp. KGMB 08714]|uniref:hypothetical protein n=1 Tax=Sporolactobacillus sp. KGMB 08714 TaxID=3064704 RepID=UPI002FBDB5D9